MTSRTFADEALFFSSIEIDLDGDGLSETVEMSGRDELTLSVLSHGGTESLASGREVGWLNELNDQPRLGVNDVGSLTVTSEHLNGPSKFTATLVVAYRDEAYRVVGLTYDKWGLAFIDPETEEMNGQSCDMNLLTGTGFSTFPDFRDLRPRTIELRTPALEDWRWEFLTEICGEEAQ